MWTLLTIFLVSFSACYLLSFPVRLLASRLAVLDYPDQRKIHSVPIPSLGGLALLGAFAAAAIVAVKTDPQRFFLFRQPLAGLVIGAAIVTMLGLWDDVRGSGAAIKLAIQGAVGVLMYLYGFRIERITTPFEGILELRWGGLALTVLWYCIMMNAMNLIDGLDGLAAGISAIAGVTIFAISFHWDEPLAAFLALTIVGISVGFLPHNFYPAKIFMGDTGSLLLGFLLASLTLITNTKAPAILTLLVPLVALGLPLVDTLYAFLRRCLMRAHPFRADNRHLHHRLLALGLSHKRVVILLYYVSGYLGVMAYILSKVSPGITLLTVLILAIGLFLLIENLNFLERRGKSSHDTSRDP
jgi:UDP-GlcNAc:undecaprenyl-phosphate GlcNAc-1-phosphate transferase